MRSKGVLMSRLRSLPLILVGCMLSTAFISCGQSQTQVSSTHEPKVTWVASITTTPHASLTTLLKLNPEMSDDIAGRVHVQLHGVEIDSLGAGAIGNTSLPLAGGINCGSVLVLSSSALSFNNEELRQMRTYVNATFSNVVLREETEEPPQPPDNPNATPSELRWVQGVPGTSCVGEMEITNIGDAPIQIFDAGVDLAQTPVVNTFQYHLIDKCSLLGGCVPSAAGGGPACIFYADIQMGLGKAGSTYQGTLMSNAMAVDGPCQTPIILESHHVVDIVLRFTLAPQATTGMIFQVRPFLTLGASSGTVKVMLPNLVSTLVFAHHGQYGCYVLHGNTFTLDTSVDLSKAFDGTGEQGALCV